MAKDNRFRMELLSPSGSNRPDLIQMGAEWLPSLSVVDLESLLTSATPDQLLIFDEVPVIKRMTQVSDPAKRLLFSKYGGGRNLDVETILKLATESEATKCALLSNTRIDWYWNRALGGAERLDSELLVPAIKSPERAPAVALLRNPRMDRRFIADAIAGRGSFSGTLVEVRIEYAAHALEAREIPTPFWRGKDSPDDNEMYFDEPIKAAWALAKEALPAKNVYMLVNALLQHRLDLKYEDWLPNEQLETRRFKYPQGFHVTCDAILSFVAQEGRTIAMLPGAEVKEYERYIIFAPGDLLVLLARGAIRRYPQSFNEEAFRTSVECDVWAVRAGAYAAAVEDKPERLFDLLGAAREDPVALFRGLPTTEAFWQLRYAPIIQTLAKAAQIPPVLLERINEELRFWPRQLARTR